MRLALEAGGFEVCGEAATAADAVDVALRERPDVCVFDIRMKGSGIDAAAAVSAKLPETAIVFLTISRDDDDLFAALRAGASGYLLKEISPEQLPKQLERVLAGEGVLPGALLARVIDQFRRGPARRRIPLVEGRDAVLSEREWEVLALLGEGLSTKEVAAKLFVTPGTVRSHVAATLRKLRVGDRAEALALLDGR